LDRSVSNFPAVHCSPSTLALGVVWCAVAVTLGMAYFLVARGCGYENGAVISYLGYFALYVVLPGVVGVSAVRGQRLSWESAIALGVPTGFALEIAGFLACSAAGLRGLYPYLPVAWFAWGVWLARRQAGGVVRWEVAFARANVALALSVVVLVTVLSAVSQMYAEAPLYRGLPTGGLAHDWLYLVARAATIKNHWPLEDPSLAGAPLQYHYFMLVHTAAAAAVTGTEVTLVFLRLAVIPLGVVLVVQAYALGRRLSRNPAGGVLAAFFTMMAGELSRASCYTENVYLGIFVKWLYLSPTFFFGMIFFAALLLAVAMTTEPTRHRGRQILWLTLLAAAATGAKGTVMPTLLIALAIWIAWQWLQTKKMPGSLVAIWVAWVSAFGLIYWLTMAAWGSGEARLSPLNTLRLAGFWREFFPVWREWLAHWLPRTLSSNLAALACAGIVFLGAAGLRVLALPYLVWPSLQRRKPMAMWLGLVFLSSYGPGLVLELNSDSQLYVFLLMRLPLAVLAAAFMVSLWQRICGWRRRGWGAAPAVRENLGPEAVRSWQLVARRRFALATVAGAFFAALFVFQASLWVLRNGPALERWLHASTRVEQEMGSLRQALAWVRENTEPNAVLVANAFTPENLKKDRWGAIDHTRVGLHFYYSALSERRLWVEGPTYSLDPAEAQRRMQRAADVFYRARSPQTTLAMASPCYLLLDRSMGDEATVALAETSRVFANARIEIYRVPSLLSTQGNTFAGTP
jgi:hypothetical protein